MNFDPNNLYYKIVKYVHEHKNDDDKIILGLEGSSRSSKTWDFIHFLVTYCDHNRNKKKEIYVFRDTLINCKDYTLKEFIKCLDLIGVPYKMTNPMKPDIDLFGNMIYFRGLVGEGKMEAAPSNICYVNELLDVDSYNMISGWIMRCTEIFCGDWNPKFTEHWAFDLEKRPNAVFYHSTYKNNKHLPNSVINEIESYNPEIQENIDNGTADDFRWKVYGLGLRAAPEGLVHKNITWIDELPEDYDSKGFGMDYGFTVDPTALVEVRRKGFNLYAKLHIYQPFDDVDLLHLAIKDIVEKHFVIADSSDKNKDGKKMNVDLCVKGLKVAPVSKGAGSIKYGNDIMHRFKLHIVRNPHARKEAENYKYMLINGINTGVPIDKFNHFWDAFRYYVMTMCRF